VYSGTYRNMNTNKRDVRIGVLFVFFLLFGVFMTARLFKLQVIDNNYYIALASGQHEIFKQLFPVRGEIYIQDPEGDIVKDGVAYYPMATNITKYLLYAVPKDIEDPDAVMEALKEVFELKEKKEDDISVVVKPVVEEVEKLDQVVENESEIEEKEEKKEKEDDQELIDLLTLKLVKENDPYEPLRHLVSEEEIEKLKAYNLEGVYWIKEVSRLYPEKNIGSNLLGFVGKQAENNMLKGYYGLEGCYNKDLSGEAGFLRSEMDTFGRWIAIAGKDFRRAENGNSLVLTIDKSIQFYACDQLNKYVERFDADGGSLIVMDPNNGRILALCNAPDYDPNVYNEVDDIDVFNNPAITRDYEPGSVFKPITMAAALNSGKVDPFTGYQDNGELHISGHVIKNSDLKAHGWQTMTQVLEKSLNTGSVFAARQVGIEMFKKYVEEFGFGIQTEVDICQEAKGNIRALDIENDIYLATASFGQGITVTPIQLVRAFGAIANDGKLVQPYLIETVLDEDGEIVSHTEPKVVTQVISPQTSKLLGGMMASVVKNGHATKAGVDGYLVAGKTGTAQVPDLQRGGYSDKTIHTFVGFAPLNNPRFVMLTKLDHPTAVQYSSDSAAPLFGQVSKFLLNYMEVPPEVR